MWNLKPWGHIILELFDILPNFSSLQIKRSVIFGKNNGIYELPHECERLKNLDFINFSVIFGKTIILGLGGNT